MSKPTLDYFEGLFVGFMLGVALCLGFVVCDDAPERFAARTAQTAVIGTR